MVVWWIWTLDSVDSYFKRTLEVWVGETDMSSIKVLSILGYDIEYTGDNIPISSMKESIIEWTMTLYIFSVYLKLWDVVYTFWLMM